MNKAENIPLFFIIGRPRSGTTLLRLLLEAHPNVVVPPESPIILSLYKKYWKKNDWSGEDITELFNDVRKQRYFESWLINEDKLKEKLLSCAGKNSFTNILKTIYLTYPSMYGKDKIHLIGDKNPAYSLYINRINKLYPDSKFIYISRDYRDNYLSLIRVNFEVPVIPLVVFRWKYAYKQFKKLRNKNPDTFYYLKYEDLVREPELQFRKICDFLNIEYRQEVFDFHTKKKEMEEAYGHSEELLDIHQSLLNPINTSRIEIWKEEMHKMDVKKADLVAGKTAEKAGYVRKYRKFNLGLYLRVLPTLIYGRLMYSLMLWGERLPYKIRNNLLEFLGIFLKMYWTFNRKRIKKDRI